MRSLVDPMAGEIERSADQIAASTTDVNVKRASIRWKIEGVPALRNALFQPGPFIAVLDTWVLIFQMSDYFETGPGKMSFGSSAPIAVNTCRNMDFEFGKVVATLTVSKDSSKIRDYARQWAKDHPIRYSIQDRESTLSRVTEMDLGGAWTLSETIAELTTTADDMHREMQIYSDHLFRQARWEADLLKLDLGGDNVLPMAERAVKSSEQAVTTLDRLAPAIQSAAETATIIPGLVSSERKIALDSINDNVSKTLTFLTGARFEVLKGVNQDVLAVVTQISRERLAAMQQVSDERIAVLRSLHEERIAAISEVRDIAESQRAAMNRDIEQTGVKLVDHAIWRLAELTAAAFLILLVTALMFLFLIRRLFFSSGAPDRSLQRYNPAA